MPAHDHPIQRAQERYGLALDAEDLRRICEMVQNNKATLDRSKPWKPGYLAGTTVWFVRYKDVKLRVVVSSDFYSVVTFLPKPEKKRARKRRRHKIYVDGRARYVERAA